MGRTGGRPRTYSDTSSGQRSSMVRTPSIGRRILSATNSSLSLSTFNSMKPQSPSIPRMRILLAPYMSPFVVPMHKVETWELLHKTLFGLFGLDLASNSAIRITDHQGNSILPSVWQDLLEPDMTIIVDTFSLQAESSPIMFISPAIPAPSYSLPLSSAGTVGRSDELSYGTGVMVSPRGVVIGQALPMMPPPVGSYQGSAARRTNDGFGGRHERIDLHVRAMGNRGPEWANESGRGYAPMSMYTGAGSRGSSRRDKDGGMARGGEGRIMEKALTTEGAKEMKGSNTITREVQDRVNMSPSETTTPTTIPTFEPEPPKHKHGRSPFTKLARALISVFSAGKIPKTPTNKSSSKPKRTHPPSSPQSTMSLRAIENNPGPKFVPHQSLPNRHSIARRRGVPPLPPVLSPAITSSTMLHAQRPPSSAARGSKPLTRLSTPPPGNDTYVRSKSLTCKLKKGSSPTPITTISSPIPTRNGTARLDTNAQHGNTRIQENLQDIATLDGSTLAPSPSTLSCKSRNRSGTGDTVDSVRSIDKPLPRLPFKLSAFPPPSPPRSPILMAGWRRGVFRDVESQGTFRPMTATVSRGTKVEMRRVASTEFRKKGWEFTVPA